MTAMTAATLDRLSERPVPARSRRVRAAGVRGLARRAIRQPLARTREYVDIVNAALRRETVAYEGKYFTLPLPDGPGKALKLTVRPIRDHVPIYLAAVGPKNLELAGEIADGWLGILNDPGVPWRAVDAHQDGPCGSSGKASTDSTSSPPRRR